MTNTRGVFNDIVGNLKQLSKRVRKLETKQYKAGADIQYITQLVGLNNIIRIPSGTDEAVLYSKDQFGLTAALADAELTADLVWMPDGTYTSDTGFVVPDGVILIGTGNSSVIIDIDTEDEIGIEVGELSVLRSFTLDYNNTADAGALSCYAITNTGATEAGLVKDIIVYATSDNAQNKVAGIDLRVAYSGDELETAIQNVDAYVTAASYAVGIDVFANATARVAFRDMTGIAICTVASEDAKGIIINYNAGTPIHMVYDCYGYGETTHASGYTAVGIEAWESELYNCVGYGISGGARNGVGIDFAGERSIGFDCYGYGEADNAFGIDATCGIHFRASGYVGSMIVNCVGEGDNVGASDGCGILSESYGSARIVGGVAIGGDYDIIHDSGTDVLVYNLAYNSSSILGAGIISGSSIHTSVLAITADETLTVNEDIVKVDATGGDVTVTLPPVAGNNGREYTIHRIDGSANAVDVDGDGAETINDALNVVLAQYDSIHIYCDESEWWII